MPVPFVEGQEDCLYLNVYRPTVSKRTTLLGKKAYITLLHQQNARRNLTRLPVMVYIHGGGFFAGSAHPSIHGPEYFMDTKEVILVTFAYRLGVFGNLKVKSCTIL